MNVGLLYTPVSIYQMTRGALVLFVGVFSVVFLRRRLWLYQFCDIIMSLCLPAYALHAQMGFPSCSYDWGGARWF